MNKQRKQYKEISDVLYMFVGDQKHNTIAKIISLINYK